MRWAGLFVWSKVENPMHLNLKEEHNLWIYLQIAPFSRILCYLRVEIVILTLAITSFYLDNDNNYGGRGNDEKTY